MQSKEVVTYDVCFIQNGVTSEESTESLKDAFDAMDSNQMEPKWLPAEECLEFTTKEPKLFVMDPFEGKVFEHLKSLRCRIVGPLCIIYCLRVGDILPKRPHPVYSVSMRKITVSCSNINNALREDIFRKVELMGGLYSKDFTKSVTHLVVGEVGSKKYQVAANFGLPIMIPEWIEDVWSDGQHKQIHALDRCYDKYKCPVFKGLKITVSQLSLEERNAIQSIIERHGGTYLPPLKAQETTHLVLCEPSGQKYQYAKTWKIYCVNVNWIYESVKAGYCKDENLYKIENCSKTTQPKRSTPNRDLTFEMPPVECSVINNVCVVSHLDETVKSDISVHVINKKSLKSSALEEFDLATLPRNGQFLDGCKIFLFGFDPLHLEKLRKIINVGGGMRFNKYTESITHVVCDKLSDSVLNIIKSYSTKPFIVNPNWLLESCKKEQLVDEKPFLFMESTMLSPEKVEVENKSVLSNSSFSSLQIGPLPPDNISEIFNQYMPNKSQSQDTKTNERVFEKMGNNSKPSVSNAGSSTSNLQYDVPEMIDLADDDPTSSVAALFSGLKFIIAGFGEKDAELLSRMIESHSGRVLTPGNPTVADIAIVPIIKHEYQLQALNIVTNCWLQKCIEDSRIYDFSENELFCPVTIHEDKKPFASYVISVSQYTGTERDCLMHLAEVMGATCQEYFVRKANKSRGILSNTHLIVATPEGNKYEAAKKWKIPAVSKQWVLDTAKQGVAPAVDSYIIDVCSPSSKNKKTAVSEDNPDDNSSSSSSHISKQSSGSSKTSLPESRLQKSRNKSGLEVEEPLPQSSSNGIPVKTKISPVLLKATEKTSLPDLSLHKKENKSGIECQEPLPGTSTSNILTEAKISPILSKAIESISSQMLPKAVSKILSPLISKPDNSINESYESLDMNKSYKYKFRISGLLNELDSSTPNNDHSLSRRSIPVEDLFGKNLASAIKGLNCTTNSESEYSNLECEQIVNEQKIFERENKIFKNVVICVSKKLNNLQHDLNEIVSSLGGDYLWSYDDSCTHFVFSGKPNDISKDFREAKSDGKKIVCPEWVYACKEKNCILDETLYPHTLKLNMSLTNEIAIVKNNSIRKSTEKENITVDVKTPTKKDVDFNKQLNELLVAARSEKKRNSRRLVNSVSNSPTNEILNKNPRPVSDSFIKPLCIEEKANTDEPDTGSQQFSQPYPIVWDDPTGRLEREKIAAMNAQPNSRKSETLSKYQEGNSKSNQIPDKNFEESVPARNTGIEKAAESDFLKIKKFMFTNIPDPKKLKFIEIITDLGGEVSDEKVFDVTATYLIVEKPLKNEKLLSSIASGKWVLHPSYLLASEEQKRFLPEEEFEWGGSATHEFAQNLPSMSKKIASCPSRWRLKLCADSSKKGAFDGWTVVIIAEDKGKQATYNKILGVGGAEIISFEASNSYLDKISHVIVDMKKRTLSQIDLSPFISQNIYCIKPEYIAFFLTDDPPPNVENFILPEAKELLNNSLSSSKRRTLSVSTRGSSKRSRIS